MRQFAAFLSEITNTCGTVPYIAASAELVQIKAKERNVSKRVIGSKFDGEFLARDRSTRMAVQVRRQGFDGGPANGRKLRIFLLAAYPGEGHLTQLAAAVPAGRRELVFMPPFQTFAPLKRKVGKGVVFRHSRSVPLFDASARTQTFAQGSW